MPILAPMTRFLASFLLGTMPLMPLPSWAEGMDQSDLVTAVILPGWKTESGTHMAAIRLDLAPGWKTYWRAPGEAGIPPEFNWAGSQNISAVRLHWPRPVVFHTNGLQTIGYHDTLVLPVEITMQDPGQPVQVALSIDMGICRDVCVPATVSVTADLSAKGSSDAEIAGALADQPRPAAEAGLTALRCAVEPIDDGLRVTATLDMPALGAEETVVVEDRQGDVWVSEAMSLRTGNRLIATADMIGQPGQPFVLNRGDVRVTVLSEDSAVEVLGCPG